MFNRIIKDHKLLLPLIFVCILLICYLLSWIPKESVKFTVNVYMYDSNKNVTVSKNDDAVFKEDVLTVKGDVYKPWFSNGGFSGDISFEKNTQFSRQIDFSDSTVEIDSGTDLSHKDQLWINKLTYTKKSNDSEMTQDEIIAISFDDSSKNYYVDIKDKSGNYYFTSDK